MPKTAFIIGEPRTKYIERSCSFWFLNWLTVEYLNEFPNVDYPPIILSVVEVPHTDMVAITYADRYEVK